ASWLFPVDEFGSAAGAMLSRLFALLWCTYVELRPRKHAFSGQLHPSSYANQFCSAWLYD
ncbi:MAG TPA: hypothetical protein VGZ25_05155, partial [Gemmataceae bacterium]|nr:hypothetical protein [Gemmataceae bacterium]